jgi:hypothetical protein
MSATQHVGEVNGSTCRFTTLPGQLPRPGEWPFTVLLAEYFYRSPAVDVGHALTRLEPAERPHIKFLFGDQVYLDFPAFIFGISHPSSFMYAAKSWIVDLERSPAKPKPKLRRRKRSSRKE